MDEIKLDDNHLLKSVQLSESQEKVKQEVVNKVLNEGMTIKEALNADPQVFEWLYSIGYRYYQAGKMDQALPIFNFLVRVDSKDSRFPLGAAACYRIKKEYKKAIEAYMQATYFADRQDPMPWFHIADCYLKLEQKEAALISLAAFLLLAGNDAKWAFEREKALRMVSTLTDEIQEKSNLSAKEA